MYRGCTENVQKKDRGNLEEGLGEVEELTLGLHVTCQNYIFGSTVEASIELDDADKRTNVVVKTEGDKTAKLPLFLNGDTCSGKVSHFT